MAPFHLCDITQFDIWKDIELSEFEHVIFFTVIADGKKAFFILYETDRHIAVESFDGTYDPVEVDTVSLCFEWVDFDGDGTLVSTEDFDISYALVCQKIGLDETVGDFSYLREGDMTVFG